MEIVNFLGKDSKLGKYFSDRENNKLKDSIYNERIVKKLINIHDDLLIEFITLGKIYPNISYYDRKLGHYFIESISNTETLKKIISLGADPKNLDIKKILVFDDNIEMKKLLFQYDLITHKIYDRLVDHFDFSNYDNYDNFLEIAGCFGIRKCFICTSDQNICDNKTEKIEKIKLPFDMINDLKYFIILK